MRSRRASSPRRASRNHREERHESGGAQARVEDLMKAKTRNAKRSGGTAESRRAFMRQAGPGRRRGHRGRTRHGPGRARRRGGRQADHHPERVREGQGGLAAGDRLPDDGRAGVRARLQGRGRQGGCSAVPGNYDVVHAIGDMGIPVYSGRHEGSLCHAADAFCRATGEVAATSGTEGARLHRHDLRPSRPPTRPARRFSSSPATRPSSPRTPSRASRISSSSR